MSTKNNPNQPSANQSGSAPIGDSCLQTKPEPKPEPEPEPEPEPDATARPLVLIVEDDEVRGSQLQKMAKEAGWDPLVAETLEKAIEFATTKHKEIRLALIDNMIPAYKDELDILRALEKERERLSGRILEVHAKTAPADSEIRELRENLAGLDSTWRSLIVEDGGLLFLEEAAKAGWLENWRYAILSATDRIEGENAMANWGIPQPGCYLGWLQKPVDVERIRSVLVESMSAALGEQGGNAAGDNCKLKP